MQNLDVQRWNRRFMNDESLWRGRKNPAPLLERYDYLLPATGLALDAASGGGRNGLFLAQHGLRVIALDISHIALTMARDRFRQEGYALDSGIVDLSKPWLPQEAFEVILNFNFLERPTFSLYAQALKPGGVLFFSTFVRNAKRHNPDHYLMPGELHEAFPTLQIIHTGQRMVQRPDDHELPFEMKEELVAHKPAN